MKKILLYVLFFILICFFIPVIFTNKKQETVSLVEKNEIEENTIETYDYKNYNTIKLYHKDIGETEEIPLDEYLYGVVSAEMPASFEDEALKAQAVVARTYTIYKIETGNRKT